MLNTLKYTEYNWNIFTAGFTLAWSILTNVICQFLIGGILLIYLAIILFKLIWKRLHNEHIRGSETIEGNEIL